MNGSVLPVLRGLPHRLLCLAKSSDTCLSLHDHQTLLSEMTGMEEAHGERKSFYLNSDWISRLFVSVTISPSLPLDSCLGPGGGQILTRQTPFDDYITSEILPQFSEILAFHLKVVEIVIGPRNRVLMMQTTPPASFLSDTVPGHLKSSSPLVCYCHPSTRWEPLCFGKVI